MIRLAYDSELPGLVVDGRSPNEVYYLPERRRDLRIARTDGQPRWKA